MIISSKVVVGESTPIWLQQLITESAMKYILDIYQVRCSKSSTLYFLNINYSSRSTLVNVYMYLTPNPELIAVECSF